TSCPGNHAFEHHSIRKVVLGHQAVLLIDERSRAGHYCLPNRLLVFRKNFLRCSSADGENSVPSETRFCRTRMLPSEVVSSVTPCRRFAIAVSSKLSE